MKTHAAHPHKNKSQSLSNFDSRMPSNDVSTFKFVDNRPAAIAQRKLQELIDNNPKTKQLKVVQELANNSPQARQVAPLHVMANNNSSQIHKTLQRRQNKADLPGNLKPGIENPSGNSTDIVQGVFHTTFTAGTRYQRAKDLIDGLQKIHPALYDRINEHKRLIRIEVYKEKGKDLGDTGGAYGGDGEIVVQIYDMENNGLSRHQMTFNHEVMLHVVPRLDGLRPTDPTDTLRGTHYAAVAADKNREMNDLNNKQLDEYFILNQGRDIMRYLQEELVDWNNIVGRELLGNTKDITLKHLKETIHGVVLESLHVYSYMNKAKTLMLDELVYFEFYRKSIMAKLDQLKGYQETMKDLATRWGKIQWPKLEPFFSPFDTVLAEAKSSETDYYKNPFKVGLKQLLDPQTGTIALFKSMVLHNSERYEYIFITSPLKSYRESYEKYLPDLKKAWMDEDASKWANNEKEALIAFDAALALLFESLAPE